MHTPENVLICSVSIIIIFFIVQIFTLFMPYTFEIIIVNLRLI